MLHGICVEIRNGTKSAQRDMRKMLLSERATITTEKHQGACVIVDLSECDGCARRCGKEGPQIIIEDSCGIQTVAQIAKSYTKKDIVDAILLVSRWTRTNDNIIPDTHKELKILSKREKEVAINLIDGKSNKIIAREMEISETTVKVHLRSIMRKTGTENRTQAALWARSNLSTMPM